MDAKLKDKKEKLINWITSLEDQSVIDQLLSIYDSENTEILVPDENEVIEKVKSYKNNPEGLVDLERRPNDHK